MLVVIPVSSETSVDVCCGDKNMDLAILNNFRTTDDILMTNEDGKLKHTAKELKIMT